MSNNTDDSMKTPVLLPETTASNNATVENEDEYIPAQASFTTLAQDVRLHIMGSLSVQDVVAWIRATPRCLEGIETDSTWKNLLRREGLPGDTANDLIHHVEKWQEYQHDLLCKLYHIVPGANPNDIESEDGKAACRAFLARAIGAFTQRVSNAHSWYKHLPLGRDVQFELFLDLTSNMRWIRNDARWIDYEEGDGTRFHYTWTTTDDYRKKYGFFHYREATQRCTELRVHRPLDNEAVHVPRFARGPTVDVTAVIHNYSLSHNLYTPLLQKALSLSNPALVKDPLGPETLPRMSRRFVGMKDQRLPAEAALHLERICSDLLNDGEAEDDNDNSRGADDEDSERRRRRRIEQINLSATMAVSSQRYRERRAIARSLWELCHRNFGDDTTPSLNSIEIEGYS